MAAVAFDTYKMIKRLRESGFSDVQAEALTALAQEAGNSNSLDLSHLATRDEQALIKADIAVMKSDVAALKGDVAALKGDVASLRSELKGDVASLRSELKGDIASLRNELRAEIKATAAETKSDILRWMFGAMLAQSGLIVALVKLLH